MQKLPHGTAQQCEWTRPPGPGHTGAGWCERVFTPLAFPKDVILARLVGRCGKWGNKGFTGIGFTPFSALPPFQVLSTAPRIRTVVQDPAVPLIVATAEGRIGPVVFPQCKSGNNNPQRGQQNQYISHVHLRGQFQVRDTAKKFCSSLSMGARLSNLRIAVCNKTDAAMSAKEQRQRYHEDHPSRKFVKEAESLIGIPILHEEASSNDP